MNYTIADLIDMIQAWAEARGIYDPIDGSTAKDQTLKAVSEMGELADNVLKGRDCRDDIGDVIVCLVNIAALKGYSLQECIAKAYDDIKDRKGQMVGGVFIKEGDIEK